MKNINIYLTDNKLKKLNSKSCTYYYYLDNLIKINDLDFWKYCSRLKIIQILFLFIVLHMKNAYTATPEPIVFHNSIWYLKDTDWSKH